MSTSLKFQYDIKIEDLGVTTIENSFISLYMPQMPGNYVKIYLFGLRACQYGQPEALNNAVIAETLGLAESDIDAAWQYFKRIGIVDFVYDQDGCAWVSYHQIAAKVLDGKMDTQTPADEIDASGKFGTPEDIDEKRVADMYKKIQNMIGSKPLSKSALFTFRRFITEYGLEPEAVCILVEHGLNSIEKKNVDFTVSQSLSYLEAIAKGWQDKGVVTYEDAEAEIKKSRERNRIYRDVLRYLGLKRNIMVPEKEMIDAWFDEFHFNMDVIREALSRAPSPSIKYVNAILVRWHDKGYKTAEDIKKEQKPRAQNKKTGQPSKEDSWLSEQFDALENETMAEMIEKSKQI